MIARRVSMQLKPNSVAEFTQRIEKDILPLLRQQTGFRDENHIRCPRRNGSVRNSVCGITERTRKLTTGILSRGGEDPARVVEGNSKVETYDVANSTSTRSPLPQQPKAGKPFRSGGAAQVRPFRYPERGELVGETKLPMVRKPCGGFPFRRCSWR